MSNAKWNIDPTHSEIQFKVKHLMITTVTGRFNSFNATVETEGDDFTTAKINFAADIDSINTNNEQRDGHLKTNDFFDAANHPQITFVGTGMDKVSDDTYKLHGDFSMRGVTKPITLDVEFAGLTKDPWGNERAGFELKGVVNRKDYGVNYNAALEGGGLLLSEDVKIIAEVQFVKEAATVAA